MGKGNTAKKGKQKAPTTTPVAPVGASPPPPLPPPPAGFSPPAAHHVQPLPITVDTIEEEEVWDGPAEVTEEESWQDVGRLDDNWAADAPGDNSRDLDDEGWESGPGVTQAPMSPLPSQHQRKPSSGAKDHTKSFYPQQSHRLPSSSQQLITNASARSGSATSWGRATSQQPHDTWAPERGGWPEDDGSGDEDEDDGWVRNDGWDGANSGWGQQPHSATWNHAVAAHSARSAHSKAAPRAPTSGWQSWGEEARRLPKVTFDPAIPPSPSSTRSKPVVSQQQTSRILNALLNDSQQAQQPYPMPPSAGASFLPGVANNWQQHRHQAPQHEPHRSHEREQESKKIRKSQPLRQDIKPQPRNKNDRRQQEEVHDVWGLGDGWSDLHDEEEEEEDMTRDAWGRKVHFTPSALRASMLPSSAPSIAPSTIVENLTVNALPQNKLGLSTIPMSKTLSYAYSGTTPSTESEPGRAAMQRITDFQFIESRGDALKSVQRAFYGKQRKAADRFHWLFPPDKDERVSSLLKWINSMSFGIASFGLQKFLQTRERGALVVNAAYRPVHSPGDPVFDWVGWNQIQRTMDRILQESVGYYNPAMHIIVFVFLPSPTGNSVAIWRRKLPIPNNIRLAYQAQITQAMASLRKEYPVLVDECAHIQGCELDPNDLPRLPLPPEPIPPPPPKKKRKWWKFWLSS